MRIRGVIWATLAALVLAEAPRAAVNISHQSKPAFNLPGFTSYTLTATSDVPGELIHAVDFVGDGSNDPATGRGFFGPMHHESFPLPMIFELGGIPPLIAILRPPPDDSHFLAADTKIVVPPGLAEEGPNLLQAAWAWQQPIGQSFDLAQIVISDAATIPVTYRGSFAVTRNGAIVDTPEVSGTILPIPEPAVTLLCALALLTLTLFPRLLLRRRTK